MSLERAAEWRALQILVKGGILGAKKGARELAKNKLDSIGDYMISI